MEPSSGGEPDEPGVKLEPELLLMLCFLTGIWILTDCFGGDSSDDKGGFPSGMSSCVPTC